MRVLATVWSFLRLFGALACVAVGFLWSRCRATRRFRRRLARADIPPEVSAVLTQGYREMISVPLRKWIANRGA